MSANVLGLTTYDSIRVQAGITVTDISDNEINDLGVADELELELLGWFPNYVALTNDSNVDSDPLLKRQLLALQSYAKHYGAYQLVVVAPLKFYQKRADGDNQASRFTNENALNDFKEELYRKSTEKKNLVLSISTDHSPTEEEVSFSVPVFSVSSPDSDKITEG